MKGAESFPAVEEIWTIVPGLETGKDEAAKREKEGAEEEEEATDDGDDSEEEETEEEALLFSPSVLTPASLFSAVLSPLPAPSSGANACVTQVAPKKLTSMCCLTSESGWCSKGPGTATPAQLTSPASSAVPLAARCLWRE